MKHGLRLLGVGLLILAATGCASQGWVEEHVQQANQTLRADIDAEVTPALRTAQQNLEASEQRADKRFSTIDERFDNLKTMYGSKSKLSNVEEAVEKLTSNLNAVQTYQMKTVTVKLNEISERMAHNAELYRDLEDSHKSLMEARADFTRHRATVDNKVSEIEAEVSDLRSQMTELGERQEQLNYLQFLNLKRKAESLNAELELIDKLMDSLSGKPTEIAGPSEEESDKETPKPEEGSITGTNGENGGGGDSSDDA